MAKMKVAQIPKAGADFEIIERRRGLRADDERQSPVPRRPHDVAPETVVLAT